MTDTRPGLRRQLVRFFLVGVVSAVVDYSLLLVGMGLGLSHTPAKVVSWVFGTLTAYAHNRRWTFQAGASGRTFAAVMVLYALTFVVQVGLFALVYPPLERSFGVWWAQTIGFVIAQGVATTTNFIVQRTVIFRG